MSFRLRFAAQTAHELAAAGGLATRARGLPRLLVFLLLLCFVVQGAAVQSHVHFVEQGNPLTATAGHTRLQAAPSNKGNSPSDCPLCQEAATAGAYVLPPIPALPPPPAVAPEAAVAAIAAYRLALAPLGWLSRAPPE